MGTPTQQIWPEGCRLASALKFRFPRFPPTPLNAIIKHASAEALDLIAAACHWDPKKRPTAVECLQHPYFQSCVKPAPSLRPSSRKLTKNRQGTSGLNVHQSGTGYRRAVQRNREELRPQKKQAIQKQHPPFRRLDIRLSPLVGQKIVLNSHPLDEDGKLPPLRKQTDFGSYRSAFRPVPMNFQKAPSVHVPRRTTRNSSLLFNARKLYCTQL